MALSASLAPSAQPELLRDRLGFLRDRDRAGVVARQARTGAHARQDPCARPARRAVAENRQRPLAVLVGQVAPARDPVPLGDEHLGLRGPRVLADREKRVSRLREPDRVAAADVMPDGDRAPEEQVCAFGSILGPEPERGVVEAFGSLGCVQRGRTVAGGRAARALRAPRARTSRVPPPLRARARGGSGERASPPAPRGRPSDSIQPAARRCLCERGRHAGSARTRCRG